MLIQTGTPASEPITLAEARVHLRLDSTAEDALVTAWITAARQDVEAATGRVLIRQDWEMWLPCFPKCREPIEIPYPPLVQVTSVKTADADGVLTTMAAADYQVEAPSGDRCQPARVYPAAGAVWPYTITGVRGAVRVAFQAGYVSASAVPQPLRSAILLLVGDLYENREAGILTRGATPQALSENPTVARLIAPYRVWHF